MRAPVVSLSLSKFDTTEISISASVVECFRCNAQLSPRYRVASLLHRNYREKAFTLHVLIWSIRAQDTRIIRIVSLYVYKLTIKRETREQ